MQLRQLRLLSFKNHPDKRFDFTGDLVAFCGRNGVGKTNVLDAIHILCMCKSYFQHIESNSIQHGEAYYSVFGKVDTDEAHELGCLYQRGQGKTFQFDKVPYERLADHIGKMPVVFIAPGDISLIHEGSEERRRFMDIILSQTDGRYLRELMTYQRALDQRNKQLKLFAERGYVDSTLLESLNQQLIQPSVYLHEKRVAFVESFRPSFEAHHQALAQGNEEAGLHYQSDLLEMDLASLLRQNAAVDLDAARTTKGLHKDDLEFELNGYPLKKFGSQGQIKTFLIALKLAQFDYLQEQTGVKPFLLLDDIFEKLDESRIARLMELVAENHFGQIFITDTHRDRVESIFSEIGRKAEIFVLE
ncbi:MAG: DNA replication and repair protein RecF [Bacteroidota bacterium]|nr:DNA replication and repair protein RecF [Bacteroidota bacterium]MDX5431595.1 DNA replication and repair protein RecF [Bacteroidota bacterium]MDX5470316.1 DNA replication and repair protein RecF [Bacteroidota bacterium]